MATTWLAACRPPVFAHIDDMVYLEGVLACQSGCRCGAEVDVSDEVGPTGFRDILSRGEIHSIPDTELDPMLQDLGRARGFPKHPVSTADKRSDALKSAPSRSHVRSPACSRTIMSRLCTLSPTKGGHRHLECSAASGSSRSERGNYRCRLMICAPRKDRLDGKPEKLTSPQLDN